MVLNRCTACSPSYAPQDQYIELNTWVRPSATLYGAGERSSATTYITVRGWDGWYATHEPGPLISSPQHHSAATGDLLGHRSRSAMPQTRAHSLPVHPFPPFNPLPGLQRNGYPYTLWARDLAPAEAMRNSYSSWPFVMVLEAGGWLAHRGVVQGRPTEACRFQPANHSWQSRQLRMAAAWPALPCVQAVVSAA